ncbi:MAG: DNA-binding protein [Propionibacteriales bacterium]|nr:MAG: DNA-binding protein [Propionibacteriales bacterium]
MNISDAIKRVLVGKKLASTQLSETLLPKRIALPVFASDALSSVAYAPDEILLTLSLAGMTGLAFSWPIAIVVAVVMIVVVTSYRQNVHAYPSGGGDYEVATVNLGPNAGLTVASALLVDYVLTVAVSVSSGVQNAEAMIPQIRGHEGPIAAVVVLILMGMNLRGVRESGTFFAIPTYAFMVGILGMTAWGLTRILVLGEELRAETADYTIVGATNYQNFTGLVMVALLMRAFSSGCAALTGVEAITNGVPAFQPPKSKNAATTLGLLGVVAISMMIGIIALSNLTQVHLIDEAGGSYYITPDGEEIRTPSSTAVGQLAKVVFSDFQPGFYYLIISTMIILFLAANTAFNGFPVLGSILAKDGYLPRQLHTRGDRLAYSNGIVLLAASAMGLVLVFNASVTALIQLYVVGVFVSFTLSQTGMMRHWTRHLATETDPAARKRMQRSRIINGIGMISTGFVLIVVLLAKFTHGAYLAIVAMIVVFAVMKAIKAHYTKVAREIALTDAADGALPSRVHAVVFVSALNKPTARAIAFAKASRPSTLEGVVVAVDPDETQRIVEEWADQEISVPLQVIASPFREVTNPFLEYVKHLRTKNPRDMVCVYIPEFVVGHWWEQALHNQTGLLIRTRLYFMPGVIVSTVPYQLSSSRHAKDRFEREDPLAWRRAGQHGISRHQETQDQT